MTTLRSFFANDLAISPYKRGRILDLVSNHYKEHAGDRKTLEIVHQPLESRALKVESLNKVRIAFYFECNDFATMVNQAQELVASADVGPGPQPPLPIPIPPDADHLLHPNFSLLASGMPFEKARNLVSKIYLKNREFIPDTVKVMPDTQNYHEVLTDFFTSPDVFPYFKDTNTSWSLSEFTAAVNSRILDPLLEEILDAFTGFCHRSGELFYITAVTRRIKPHTLGCETCVDEPIGGPSRKNFLSGTKRPRGIDKAECQLCEHADDFDYHPRETTAHELQDKMAYWNRSRLGGLISRFVVGPNNLKRYLDHWSLVGKFFVWADP